MISLLNDIKSRLETLLDGVTYKDPAGSADVEPRVVVGPLPYKTSTDEDFPFVTIIPTGGTGDIRSEITAVKIGCGIWNDTSDIEGITDITALVGVIKALAATRAYTGYKINSTMSWRFGDEEGLQPRPYYVAEVNFSFKSVPQLRSGR